MSATAAVSSDPLTFVTADYRRRAICGSGRRRPILGRVALAAILLSSLGAPPAVAADQGMEAHESPLKRTLPLAKDSTRIAFPLFATDGSVANVKAKVINIVGPDGRSVAETALEVDEVGVVKRTGTIVRLTVVDSFDKPGDYRVTLVFCGKIKVTPVRLVQDLIIVRLSPTTNAADLSGTTLVLWRWWPGRSVSAGAHTLRLIETSGASALTGLRLLGRSIRKAESNTLVPGRLDVKLINSLDSVPPHGSVNLEVTVSGLRKTGALATGFYVRSFNTASDELVELALHVSDRPLFPLLVILIGVGVGFGLVTARTFIRPYLKNKCRIAVLRDLIAELKLKHQTDKDMLAKLECELTRLQEAETENRVGNAARAKDLIEDVWKKIEALTATVGKAEYDLAKGRDDILYKDARWSLFLLDAATSVVAVFIATLTGLWLFYVGEPFGSGSDYLKVFLWGFGIDGGIRSARDVIAKIRGA